MEDLDFYSKLEVTATFLLLKHPNRFCLIKKKKKMLQFKRKLVCGNKFDSRIEKCG